MSLFTYEINKMHNKEKSLPNQIFYQYPSVNVLVQKGAPRFACKASFTVEAAIIIPLLTCFFVSILFFFHILEVQMQVQTGLDLTGRKLAVYTGVLEEETSAGNAIGVGAAKAYLQKELAGESEVDKWVKGGIAGISLLHSKVDGDYLELVATYHVKLPLNLLKPLSVSVAQKTKVRKWTGWNSGSTDATDIWVYITETGSVYHTTKSCSYLDLSIEPIAYLELETKRSLSGAIYYACPICAVKQGKESVVYITNYGNRYHLDLNCSGIKRTIYTIRKSEVGDRRACSKCGNCVDKE